MVESAQDAIVPPQGDAVGLVGAHQLVHFFYGIECFLNCLLVRRNNGDFNHGPHDHFCSLEGSGLESKDVPCSYQDQGNR